MSITRKFLKAMGIEDDKIDQIIDAHTETVDGLKADIDKYREDAEKLPGVQKELNDLKAAGDAVLTIAHGAGLDAVQSLPAREERKAAEEEDSHGGDDKDRDDFFKHRRFLHEIDF